MVFANNEFVKEESSVFTKPLQTLEDNVQEESQEIVPENSAEGNRFSQELPTQENTEPVVEKIVEQQPNTAVTQKQNIEENTQSLDDTTIEDSIKSVANEEVTPLNSQDESLLNNEIPKVQAPTNYFSEVIIPFNGNAKTLYVSFKEIPKTIYKNQRFEVVVKALVTTDDFDRIETRFINAKEMIPLNPATAWSQVADNTFENRYFFKAYEPNFIFPTLQVLLYKDGVIKEVSYLNPEEIQFSEIARGDKRFSSVIAKDLQLKAYKSKQYNNNELITILDIEAYESNLEDFNLTFVNEQGFSSIQDFYPEQKMLYYLVMPIHKKKVEFTYYNTKEKALKKIVIPIQLENELVSTQTDLNPNNSNILFYKKIALGVLVALFLGLFIWKRNYLYLIVLLIALIVLILYMMPNRQAFIKADSTIYILPTKNSTIFYKTGQARVAEIVMRKAGFIKIMMNVNNKKIIGWIKEEQLVKN